MLLPTVGHVGVVSTCAACQGGGSETVIDQRSASVAWHPLARMPDARGAVGVLEVGLAIARVNVQRSIENATSFKRCAPQSAASAPSRVALAGDAETVLCGSGSARRSQAGGRAVGRVICSNSAQSQPLRVCHVGMDAQMGEPLLLAPLSPSLMITLLMSTPRDEHVDMTSPRAVPSVITVQKAPMQYLEPSSSRYKRRARIASRCSVWIRRKPCAATRPVCERSAQHGHKQVLPQAPAGG